MNSSQKTLLILGGGIMQVPAMLIARKKGIRVVVFDRNTGVPGAELADSFLPVDIADEEACLEAARDIHHKGDLQGVMTLGTDFSTSVAKITETLGLPGHGYQAAMKAKDKYLMRQAFRSAGVPSPDFMVLGDPSDVQDIGFEGPWVVKPSDSMGARGVQLVHKREDLFRAAEEALVHSRKNTAMVEEFIPGREFSLDALVAQGSIFLQGLADRDIRFPPRFIEMGHRFPSDFPLEHQESLFETFRKGIHSLGLTHGAAKGDLRWHPTKGPMVGEIAARLSGGYMSGWTYPLSSSLSSVEQAISLALGETITLRGSPGLVPVAERAFISAPGRLKVLEGVEELRKIPGFQEVFLNKKPGDPMVFPKSNVEKVGNFILTAETSPELDARIHQAYACLLVRLEPRVPETDAWLSDPEGPYAFSNDSELDYYGFTRQEVLDRFRNITGQDGRLLGHKDGKFWKYLEKGGLQGLVYYWDSCFPPGY